MQKIALIIVGVVFIFAGAVALANRGIPYNSRDVVMDVGPLTATAESSRTWPVSPILSGLAIAGGVVLTVAGARHRQ